MNRKITAVLMAQIMIFTLMVMVSCGKDEEEAPEAGRLASELKEDDKIVDDPALENEVEDAVILPIKHDEEDFIGNWRAVSEQAEYLYGKVYLKINEDGTWKGSVTDEPLKGKWKTYDQGIAIKDDQGLVYWKLYYGADGVLMFQDIEDPDVGPIVLKPGPASN